MKCIDLKNFIEIGEKWSVFSKDADEPERKARRVIAGIFARNRARCKAVLDRIDAQTKPSDELAAALRMNQEISGDLKKELDALNKHRIELFGEEALTDEGQPVELLSTKIRVLFPDWDNPEFECPIDPSMVSYLTDLGAIVQD